jgi:hypothetical protein
MLVQHQHDKAVTSHARRRAKGRKRRKMSEQPTDFKTASEQCLYGEEMIGPKLPASCIKKSKTTHYAGKRSY